MSPFIIWFTSRLEIFKCANEIMNVGCRLSKTPFLTSSEVFDTAASSLFRAPSAVVSSADVSQRTASHPAYSASTYLSCSSIRLPELPPPSRSAFRSKRPTVPSDRPLIPSICAKETFSRQSVYAKRPWKVIRLVILSQEGISVQGVAFYSWTILMVLVRLGRISHCDAII